MALLNDGNINYRITSKSRNIKYCTWINNNHGFTVMEIMIVVIIIAIAMSLSIYSINIIFSANADSFADQFKTDLRYIKDQNMSTSSGTYSIEWHDDGTDIYYEVLKDGTSQKNVEIHKAIEVTYNSGSVDGVIIIFDASDGTVNDDPFGNNGAGMYNFINNASNTDVTVTLIEETGRID